MCKKGLAEKVVKYPHNGNISRCAISSTHYQLSIINKLMNLPMTAFGQEGQLMTAFGWGGEQMTPFGQKDLDTIRQ